MKRILFFFFNDTATTAIYTLSLHDALPISTNPSLIAKEGKNFNDVIKEITSIVDGPIEVISLDRKSTRLNSSHVSISYAVFCLKKKKKCSLANNTLKYYAAKINIETRHSKYFNY